MGENALWGSGRHDWDLGVIGVLQLPWSKRERSRFDGGI